MFSLQGLCWPVASYAAMPHHQPVPLSPLLSWYPAGFMPSACARFSLVCFSGVCTAVYMYWVYVVYHSNLGLVCAAVHGCVRGPWGIVCRAVGVFGHNHAVSTCVLQACTACILLSFKKRVLNTNTMLFAGDLCFFD